MSRLTTREYEPCVFVGGPLNEWTPSLMRPPGFWVQGPHTELVINDPEEFAKLTMPEQILQVVDEEYFYDRLPARDSNGRWIYLCIEWPEDYIIG